MKKAFPQRPPALCTDNKTSLPTNTSTLHWQYNKPIHKDHLTVENLNAITDHQFFSMTTEKWLVNKDHLSSKTMYVILFILKILLIFSLHKAFWWNTSPAQCHGKTSCGEYVTMVKVCTTYFQLDTLVPGKPSRSGPLQNIWLGKRTYNLALLFYADVDMH